MVDIFIIQFAHNKQLQTLHVHAMQAILITYFKRTVETVQPE